MFCLFQRRLANAAKKAIAKIPQRSVKYGDKVGPSVIHVDTELLKGRQYLIINMLETWNWNITPLVHLVICKSNILYTHPKKFLYTNFRSWYFPWINRFWNVYYGFQKLKDIYMRCVILMHIPYFLHILEIFYVQRAEKQNSERKKWTFSQPF